LSSAEKAQSSLLQFGAVYVIGIYLLSSLKIPQGGLIVAFEQRLSSLSNVARAPEGRTRGEQNTNERPRQNIHPSHAHLPFSSIAAPFAELTELKLAFSRKRKRPAKVRLNQDREK
jgi:hypothetical protein